MALPHKSECHDRGIRSEELPTGGGEKLDQDTHNSGVVLPWV
jgi:hypothetical protein